MSVRVAWAAGLIDGDGCFTVYVQKGRYKPQLRVNMTCLRTIEALQESLGTGTISGHQHRPPRLRSWQWWCPTADLPRVLSELMPHLVTKHSQAWLVWLLLHVSSNDYVREAIRLELRSFKSKPGRPGPR